MTTIYAEAGSGNKSACGYFRFWADPNSTVDRISRFTLGFSFLSFLSFFLKFHSPLWLYMDGCEEEIGERKKESA